MDLRQLEAFAAVMSAGSVTGAGQLLGRSQPAVSRLIQELEQELGFALFERSGPKVIPTQKAFLLHAEVENALAGVQQVRKHAQNLSRGENLELRLACTPALAAGLVPGALARLTADAPQQINLRSMAAEQVVQAVLSKTVDLGVVSLPLEHRGLEVHWIGEAACQAVFPEDWALARQPSVSLADLTGHTLITLSNPYRLRRRIDQALADNTGGAPQVLETNSSLNAVTLAKAGLGVALVDPFTAVGVPLKGMVVRPLTPAIPFFFGLISAYAHPLSSSAQALVRHIEDTAQALLPDFVIHPASAHDSLLHSVYATAEKPQ